jgi:predicted RNase H-like HicB family nuclease
MRPRHLAIEAVWDKASGKWNACSPDLPEFSTGAQSLFSLVDALRDVLPELVDDQFVVPEEPELDIALDRHNALIDLARRLA